MTTFLLDIWHDLREKRLWPVAVGLLIALVAVPVVMIKPAETPPPNDVAPPAKTAALPTVALDQGIVDGSALDTFDIKDPFSAGSDRVSAGPTEAGTAEAGGAEGAGGGSGSESGGGSASGGGTAGGSGGSAPGGSGGSGGGTKYFTYTVDVAFGKPGGIQTYKGMKTLDLLPDDQNPVVSFMGMTDNAKTAVFFIVDPAFEASGEGECRPDEDDCRFIYLGVDDDRDEETLSAAEGALEYTLKLNKINIQDLDQSEAIGDAQPTSDAQPVKWEQRKRKQRTLLTLPTLR